ncbi:MAG: GNAT family N-acetyltransferase [Oscillospiraceae bacterium]|nr:GNAT family N-acetyltransferase [Oscillospiraceae bacterium]
MKEILSERLVLRPMCTDYLMTTHEYASDKETCRYMVYFPNDSIEDTMYYLTDAEAEFTKERPSYYEMAVFCGDIHIGAVSLYLVEERTRAELGWTLNKKYHGHGYATEAAGALIGFAAEELGIKTFIAHCDTENTASRRVMEKLGMKLVSEHGGRKNKLSDEERREYMFEMHLT